MAEAPHGGFANGFGDAERLRWFAVMTVARREALAAKRLGEDGFRVWYPCITVVFRRGRGRGRLFKVQRPYFARYLFVAVRVSDSLGQAISAVNDTLGVATVVHLNGDPLQIPNPVMTELFDRADTDGIVVQVPDRQDVSTFEGQVGDRVCFASDNPFGGLVEVVSSLARLDAHNEIGLWLKMLGQTREVFVPVSMVRKIVRKNI